jgi:hypothetical protein
MPALNRLPTGQFFSRKVIPVDVRDVWSIWRWWSGRAVGPSALRKVSQEVRQETTSNLDQAAAPPRTHRRQLQLCDDETSPFKTPRNKSRFVRNLAKEAGQQIRVCVVKQLIDSDIRIDGFG